VIFIYNGNLVTKKDEILSFAGKWMKLENILFSEVSQPVSEGQKLHVFSNMWNTDLIQIQKYYEKQVTLGEVTYKRRNVKEGS
jgi:hypothetical protein